jgi:trigger factor
LEHDGCPKTAAHFPVSCSGIAAGLDAVHAGVAELVDALDLGSSDESCGGSSPSARTKRFWAFAPGVYSRTGLAVRELVRERRRRKAFGGRASNKLKNVLAVEGKGRSGRRLDAMQVTETLNEGLKHEFKVNVPASDLDAKADARLVDLKDKVRINGFRPGKVPVSHLKKVYGRSVMAETIDQTIRDTNTQIFTERGFRLATEPKITMPTEQKEVEQILSGKSDLTYTVSIEVVPAIQLADFKSFKVEKPVAEVSDADVDEAIKRIADQNRSYAAKGEGAKAESGDRVTINFKGTIEGVPFDGGTGENIQVTIGSNTFIPGFEEQLIGIAAGDSRTLKASFPKNYASEKLAGQPAEFETTATLVEAPQETAVNDEFAKTLGLESLDKLKQAARERLAAEFAGATRQRVKRMLLDRLDESHRFEAPPSLIDEEFNLMWTSIKAEMESGGKTFADENTTEEAAKEEYRKIADRRVRLGLVLSEIGEKNKITVTDDEVSRAVIERARQMPGREKEVWDYYRNNANALAQLRAPIYEDKVVDFILELANVTEKKVSREELYEDDDVEKSAA